MRRRGPRALLAGAVALALVAAGCGGDDFENEPRPAAPIELTAKVDNRRVVVSPTRIDGEPVGAGLVNVTISNMADESVRLSFDGPTGGTTEPIIAGGVLEYKLDLQQGNYTVEADHEAIRPFEMRVGGPRPSAQNDLLLP